MSAMRKTEIPHNTHEQLVGYVREACAVADECLLSDDDRAVLLPTILNLAAGKQLFFEQAAPVLPVMDIPRNHGR
jgi:hypothetical protein